MTYGHGQRAGYGQPYGRPEYRQGGYPQQPYGAPPPPYPQGHSGPPPYGRPHPEPPPRAKRTRPEIPAGGPVTDEDEAWAVPAYIGMFVVGFIAPAIVYLAKGRTSHFARFHAAQALNLCIAMWACNLVAFFISYFVTDMVGLLIILSALAVEFFCIVKAAIGANRHEWYRLPTFAAWPIIR